MKNILNYDSLGLGKGKKPKKPNSRNKQKNLFHEKYLKLWCSGLGSNTDQIELVAAASSSQDRLLDRRFESKFFNIFSH